MSPVPTTNERKRLITDDDEDSVKRARNSDSESIAECLCEDNDSQSDFENLFFPSNTTGDQPDREFRHVVSNHSNISQMMMRRSASSLADVLALKSTSQTQQQRDGSAQRPPSQHAFSHGNNEISPESVTVGQLKSRLSKRASVIFGDDMCVREPTEGEGGVQAQDVDRGQGYGYFIEMDVDEDNGMCNSSRLRPIDPYSRYHENDGSLAFTVPVAHDMDENQHRELAWAQAADTVDDVLGDFF